MALSNTYTGSTFLNQATRDLAKYKSELPIPAAEQVGLVNRAINIVNAAFADLISPLRIKTVGVVDNSAEIYDISGTSTYNATTKVITLSAPLKAGVATTLASTDARKEVTFWVGYSTYRCSIASVLSTTSFSINGLNLPSTNQTIDGRVSILGTTITNNAISLDNLNLAALGQQIKISVVSTATQSVRNVSMPEIDTFMPSGQNRNTIVWALLGKSLEFQYGSSLYVNGVPTIGVISIRYPSLPDVMTDLAQYVDLPDGAAIELGIAILRGMIQQRLYGKKEVSDEQIQSLVRGVQNSFGALATEEVITEKAKNILNG
jgi:hypothetical protein